MASRRDPVAERRKYASGFNSTMIKIWKERINLLGIVDTGELYRSLFSVKTVTDGDADSAEFRLQFKTYGIWQNYGTGREVPRGNPGDIGRAKVRQKRPWFDRKYFSSVMNIREFWADSLGQQFITIISDALDNNRLRQSVTR